MSFSAVGIVWQAGQTDGIDAVNGIFLFITGRFAAVSVLMFSTRVFLSERKVALMTGNP